MTGPARTGRRAGTAHRLALLAERFARGPLPVRLRAWDGSEAGPADAPAVVLRSPQALRRLLWHPGELGVAQAYVAGELDVEGDVTEVLRLLHRAGHERGLTGKSSTAAGWASAARAAAGLGLLRPPPRPPASQARVCGRRHSRGRDDAVIAHHYDLTAAFYQLLLDPQMAYSCARWESADPEYALQDAQRDKLDSICRKLGLASGMRLLDVGCGWGSLSIHAARSYGARVTAVTLSAEQGAFVTRRITDLGLDQLVTVSIQDYREISGGRYDAIASVEMGEHVGARQYPQFCTQLHRLLADGGRLLIQQMSRSGNAPGGGARRVDACRLRADDPGVAGQLRAAAGRDHWPDRRRAGPGLDALPERIGAGVRGGADERAPDPRHPARGMTGTLGATLGLSAAAVLVVMLLAFTAGTVAGRHNVADVAWGIGFAAVAVVALIASAGHGDGTRRAPLGAAARVAHLPAQPGPRRGPAVRGGARQGEGEPRLVRAAHRLPGPGRAHLGDLASGPGRHVRRAPAGGPDGGRRPALAGRAVLRGGRRPPAGDVQVRSGEPRQDHGPRAVAVYPAPELLRRRVRLVGHLPDRLRVLGERGHGDLAAADDLPAGLGLGQAAGREADGGQPPRLRAVRRPHQRLHPAAAADAGRGRPRTRERVQRVGAGATRGRDRAPPDRRSCPAPAHHRGRRCRPVRLPAALPGPAARRAGRPHAHRGPPARQDDVVRDFRGQRPGRAPSRRVRPWGARPRSGPPPRHERPHRRRAPGRRPAGRGRRAPAP